MRYNIQLLKIEIKKTLLDLEHRGTLGGGGVGLTERGFGTIIGLLPTSLSPSWMS